MRTRSLHNSSISKCTHFNLSDQSLTVVRGHEAVRNKAPQVFHNICLALEAETIQGQTAKKVADSAKNLATATGIDGNQVLATLSPDGQQTVKSFFA